VCCSMLQCAAVFGSVLQWDLEGYQGSKTQVFWCFAVCVAVCVAVCFAVCVAVCEPSSIPRYAGVGGKGGTVFERCGKRGTVSIESGLSLLVWQKRHCLH